MAIITEIWQQYPSMSYMKNKEVVA
jgi:hypothetical protein